MERGLLDMTPTAASNNRMDCGRLNIVSTSQLRLRNCAASILAEDGANLILSELTLPVSLSERMALLAHHVGNIIRVRPSEQMTPIAASRLITVMARLPIRTQRAIVKFIGKTTAYEVLTTDLEYPIAFVRPTAQPRPTSIGTARAINRRPEALLRISARSCSRVMAGDKGNGLALNMAQAGNSVLRRLSFLAATASAKGRAIFRQRCTAMMVVNKTPGLPFNKSPRDRGLLSDSGRLAAAAHAQARGIRTEGARIGYTSHVITPSRVMANPGAPDRAAGAFVALNYTIKGLA